MTASVYDFKAIAAAAQLKRLAGHNQNEVKPVEMPCDSNPQDSEYFYGVGFVAEQDGA